MKVRRTITIKPAGFLPILLLAVGLSGCLPSAEEDPGVQVVLVNAPAGERVSFLAEALQRELLALDSCCRFDFARTAPIRFQETHRDMFGSRAAPQAAAIARNLGSELAVMVSAPRFERRVERVDGGREVSGVVRLQAGAIDAATGSALGSVGSLTFRGSRIEDASGPLPDLEEDPTMLDLARAAASDLAPHLAALIEDVAYRFEAAPQRK